MVKLICKTCGKTFEVWLCFIKQKYCSKKCYWQSKKGMKSSFANKHHSKESKEKMRIGHKGKHHSPATEFKKGVIPHSKFHPECMPRGKNHSQWKGGRHKTKAGYIIIKNRNHPFSDIRGYIPKHRLVVESQIKRYLLLKEITHHRNGIKDDNRPKNLIAFTSESAHQRFHHNPHNVKPKEIIFDGRLLC